METKVMTPAIKGLILGLILIVISVVMTLVVTDFSKMQKYAWISYLIIVGGLVWAGFSYAHEMNGNVTFGNVFAHGFKATAVLTIIMVVYTAISVTIIFPEIKDKVIETARAQMEAKGELSESQIDQALSMTQKFFLPFAIGGALVSYLFLGAIGSLIGAALSKKNPNPQPFQ